MQFASFITLALAAIASATPISIAENTTLESRGDLPRVQLYDSPTPIHSRFSTPSRPLLEPILTIFVQLL